MITVNVRYYNMLRHRTGVEREAIALPQGTRLHAALERLADRHGPHLRDMLFTPQGEVASHLVIFCNRKLVTQGQHDPSTALRQSSGLGLSLADGDELMLFPAISGG